MSDEVLCNSSHYFIHVYHHLANRKEGYFATQMRAGRSPPPTPSFTPTESFFPHFNKALDLAHRLGVKPTIKTVKRLEMAQTEMAQKPCDPHPTPNKPQKRARLLQQPRGEAQGSTGKGKERAKDDDKVSLDYSGDEMEGYFNDEEMEEVNPLIDNGDNDLETMEFDTD